jgi:hypothetical protein
MPTLAELETDLAAARAARLRILDSQDYTVGDGVVQRRNRRAELSQVNDLIKDLTAQIAAQQPAATANSGRRILYGVPRC